MSLSSVGSSNPYSYLQRLLQTDSADPSDAAAPSDPLQSLFQAFSGGNSKDPLLAAATSDDGSASSSSAPQFSPDVMKALLSVQGNQANAGASKLESLFGKFDTDNDGQISQSEFETAMGPDADKAKADELFSKLDGNGDGAVSPDEMQSAMQKAHGSHHRHHHASSESPQGSDPLQALLSGTSADGTTSQSATNSDGSSTTIITYADGTKVEMTAPAASSDAAPNAASSNPEASNFANLLKQLISLQAQLVAPKTSMSV
jgi:EF hand domain-containing protein